MALVQLFAAWPQGFVYGAMLVAGWFAYRGLVRPAPHTACRRRRLGRILLCGLATAAFAATLGAAALLPRLDFSAQSAIPGGDYSRVVGGEYVAYTSPLIDILSVPPGLVLLADHRAQQRHPAAWAAGDPARPHPLRHPVLRRRGVGLRRSRRHRLSDPGAFSLMPVFERIHSHRPTATMYLVYLPLAMLAGAGAQLLLARPRVRSDALRRLLPLAVLLLAIRAVERAGIRSLAADLAGRSRPPC